MEQERGEGGNCLFRTQFICGSAAQGLRLMMNCQKGAGLLPPIDTHARKRANGAGLFFVELKGDQGINGRGGSGSIMTNSSEF